jgi:hypothetical protein
MNYYLNLPLTGIRTSLVTLTVAADDVALTVNRSPAQILSVQVCTYANASCGGFEAMTSRGYLQGAPPPPPCPALWPPSRSWHLRGRPPLTQDHA